MSTAAPMRDAALAYAAHGWHVFPLGPRKRPLGLCPPCQQDCPGRDLCGCPVDTCHGFYAATVEQRCIVRWFTEHPDWQLGIRTGALSNLVVLDVDQHAGGRESLGLLEERVGVLPGTVVQLSGSGTSAHLLYAHPGCPVSNSAGQLGPGLDVRGDGGYIVAAPTRHPRTGRPYEWLNGVWDAPLPVWPGVLRPVERVRPVVAQPPPTAAFLTPQGSPARRLAGLVQTVMDAYEGTRNARLHWSACRAGEMVAAGLLPLEVAVDALLLAAEAVGLDAAESRATVRSGLCSTTAGAAA